MEELKQSRAEPMAQHTLGLKHIKVKRDDFHEEDEEPLSPYGAIFCNPLLDAYILIIMGLNNPVHVPSMKTALQSVLSKHKRFSGTVTESDWGNRKWVRKEFDIDEHIKVVELNEHYRESADFVEKFTASLATASPPEPSIPLWQIYVLNYRSAEAEASVVFKIHHCIGDCVSLMSLFLDCTRQSSCPESMPTIRSLQKGNNSSPWTLTATLQKMWTVLVSLWCSALTLVHAFATLLWLKDGRMVRGRQKLSSHPRRLAHVTVDLEDIAIVKKAINGTVNDVVTGMLSAGLVRYFKRLRSKDGARSTTPRIRALVPVNIRSSGGLHKMEEMMSGNKARWGNAFGMWILPIEVKQQQQYLEYCRLAKDQSDMKKASFEAPFTHSFVDMLLRLFGWQAPAAVTLRMLYNTTLVFSNVLGPLEQVQFLDNPVSHIVTTVSGLPQGLVVHFQSYAEKAKFIAMAADNIFSEPDKLCMDCAYALSQMKKEALLLNDNTSNN
ncbi:wax ester synthase/diacylglycerol acyltransferase 11 [Cryptomeria japonica]|uniref:wax ester synthase/diacylglycerol acyltransferase 11 n=1 Tax=Cryptomeria japonica TaxID=3369 RepID=UPI0027DA515A|nr:wax ester synthase/diacylglycerol acyltransferase 11 [Cryptomeria japonica]